MTSTVKSYLIIALVSLFIFQPLTTNSQGLSGEIKSILSNSKNYKYSDIYVYRIKSETVFALNYEKNIGKVDHPKWQKFLPDNVIVGKDLDFTATKDILNKSLDYSKFKPNEIEQWIEELKKISKNDINILLNEIAIKEVFSKNEEEDEGEEEEDPKETKKTKEGLSPEEKKKLSLKKRFKSTYRMATLFCINKGQQLAEAYFITDRPQVGNDSKIEKPNLIGLIGVRNSYYIRQPNYISFESINISDDASNLDPNLTNPDDRIILTRLELFKPRNSDSKTSDNSDKNENADDPTLKKTADNTITKKIDEKLDDYLINLIKQEGVINITAQMQGITDGALDFLPKKYGVSTPVSEDSIQQYLRITEGQPFDYLNEHELTIGLFDVIRYRYFKEQKPLSQEEVVDDESKNLSSKIRNQFLPVFGIELKYGLNEINYPSLWSERMTLNVMWQSNKLGVILPTNGWSQLSRDFFNIERRLTNAGIGLYGSFDLPIKLINQGGVFNFNGSYVFGEANANPINSIMMIPGRSFEGRDSSYSTSLNLSYLPRFHAQAHYSFAINVDKYTFFRFKLGATAFLMQRYAELEKNVGTDPQSGRDIIEKANRKIDQYTFTDLNDLNRFDNNQIIAMSSVQASELIAGLSGRIEFMTNTEEQTVPWGGALQYFDGALSGDLWLQVPIWGFNRIVLPKGDDEPVKDDPSSYALSLRAQAQFFQTVFRDPRPWELQTVALPSLQFLVNF